MRLYSSYVIALGIALLMSEARAQESPPTAPDSEAEAPPVVDEIVVRGRRLEDIEADLSIHVHDFIGEVVRTPPGRGFARWHSQVCVGVYNVGDRAAAQYIVDRISLLALDVGLEVGEPGCQPDVNIVFATNANETASQMVENWRVFMPVGGHAGMDLGRVALESFAASDRAVRWWHVSLPADARTGAPAIETSKLCGQPHCAPFVNVAGPSRLHNGTRDDLMYVIIVVDATQVKGTTWQQLGDYLAVVSLAQIDPDSNPGAFDTILNLFTNRAAYSGLTDWDRSYVRALYEFDQERITSLQENEIVSRIVEREMQFRGGGREAGE